MLKAEADGSAYFTRTTGEADAAKITAIGTAQGAAFEAQKNALGADATALVNVVKALSEGKVKIMPDILVMGGSGGSLEGLAASLMGRLSSLTTASVKEAMALDIKAKTPEPRPTNGGPTPSS